MVKIMYKQFKELLAKILVLTSLLIVGIIMSYKALNLNDIVELFAILALALALLGSAILLIIGIYYRK